MGNEYQAMKDAEQPHMDPIKDNYYISLERADKVSCILFWISVVLMFLSILFHEKTYPTLNIITSYFSLLTLFLFFITNNAIRLYLFPRAEDARRKDFLSKAFGFDLTNLRTIGYYNNDESMPEYRMGLAILENLLFTKTILQKMAIIERIKVAICAFIWIAFLLYRESTLILITPIALTLFSEDIMAKWLRFEWARARAEKIFENTHRILQSHPSESKLFPYIIDSFADYETGKAFGSILLSDKIFNKLNPQLTKDWESIKKGLLRQKS